MKIYMITTVLLSTILQSCSAQSNNNIDFTYQRSFFEEGKIIESFQYNSKTGVYEYQLSNIGYNKVIKSIIINLDQRAKDEIYNLYLKLKPKNLHNCMFENGKMAYSSAIIFKNISLKNNCNSAIHDELNYKKIEDKLYDFLKATPQYRIEFKEEFIKR